ncbi:MAG: CAP domain-containing protein [Actinomycetota bacterium]
MRFIRARGLLRCAAPAVALLFAIGCSAGSSNGDPSALTTGGQGIAPAADDDAAFGADAGTGPTTADPADVRSGGETQESSRAGADPRPVLPVPPTLAPDPDAPESAQASPTTAPASPSTVSTAPPTTAASTTAPPETASSDTTAAASTETTVDASTPSTGADTVTSVTEAPADTSPPAETDLVAAEARSAALLNQLRAELTLAELGRTAEMDAFARDWSRQMAETGNFEHSNGPYGENIAYTTNTSLTAEEAAELFHQLWIESPSHYRNMTNDTYARSGVGLYRTDNGWYGTHVFGF